MQIKYKRGELLDENLIGLILSVAGVFVLMILLFNLFSPTFNKEEKTAESYFESLNKAIVEVEDGGVSNFFMMEDKKSYFYLVYFGNIASFKGDVNIEESAGFDAADNAPVDINVKLNNEYGKRDFFSSKYGENIICVCYQKNKDITCNYCEDLKLAARSDDNNKNWIIEEGVRIKISKEGGVYVFSKI